MHMMRMKVAAVAAAAVLCTLVSVASGNSLSISSSRMTVAIPVEFAGGFGTVRCNLTLEGSMHTGTFTKTAGALVGYVTRASIGTCAQGSATILTAALPWHVQWGRFTGTLPSISSITTNAVGAAWNIREPLFGLTCLFRTTTTEPSTGTFNLEASHGITNMAMGGTITSTCGVSGTLRGTSTSITALTVTLI